MDRKIETNFTVHRKNETKHSVSSIFDGILRASELFFVIISLWESNQDFYSSFLISLSEMKLY